MGKFDHQSAKKWAGRRKGRDWSPPPQPEGQRSEPKRPRPRLDSPPETLQPKVGTTDGWRLNVPMQVPVVAPKLLLLLGLTAAVLLVAAEQRGLGAALASVVVLLQFLEPPITIKRRLLTIDAHGVRLGQKLWASGTLRGAVWRDQALHVRSDKGEEQVFGGELDVEEWEWLVEAIDQLARHNAQRRGTADDVPDDLHGMR